MKISWTLLESTSTPLLGNSRAKDFYFLLCSVLLSHSILSSKPSPFVALAWDVKFKFVEFVWGRDSQLEDFQAHLENLECPILQLVQPESTVNLGHAHRTLNILRTIRFYYDNVCFTDFNQIRLIDVEVVPVYWPEPQAPRLSALPLPTLTQAQFC